MAAKPSATIREKCSRQRERRAKNAREIAKLAAVADRSGVFPLFLYARVRILRARVYYIERAKGIKANFFEKS